VLIILKAVDYGWTVYDAWQSARTLSDPNATDSEKAFAAANLATTVAFEAAEPDDLLPLSLPLDDLARHGIIKLGKEAGEEAAEELPWQMHHFATNKSSRWTNQMAEIAEKYGLDLDEAWNKGLLPQRGRHPDAYHEWVLEQMRDIDKRAQGNVDLFLDLYEQEVKQVVCENPAMLRKWWWEAR